jgi:hypothetical protein
MALKRVWIPSPHYSSRGGADVRLIVIHTAEGARTIESLGSWFQNPSANCSSQAGADNKPGTIGEYVTRANKAWTQSEFNPVATSLELCGFASWSTSEWKDNNHTMLENCAAWIAEEAAHFGIPITKLSASQAQGSGRGVCQHVDLGARGGGHHDCGSGFPMDYVLDMACGKGPEPEREESPLEGGWTVVNKDGRLEVFKITGRAVAHRWQDKPNAGWHAGWSPLGEPGGQLTMISVIANRDGRLEVFTLADDDGHVAHRWQTAPNQGWNKEWSHELGHVRGGQHISTNLNADGRVEVFVEDDKGDVWHRYQQKPGQGFNDEWINLGH